MMNKVLLVGRLTKDPELRYTPSGIPQVRVTLAVKRDYKNQQGQYESDFIQVTIWRKQAENTANFMRKGDILGIDGRIQTSSYEGQDGKRVYRTDIVAQDVTFIHSISRGQGQGDYNQQGGYNNQGGGYNNQQGGQGGGYNNQSRQGGQGNQGGGYNQSRQGGQGNQGGGYNQTRTSDDPFAGQSNDPFASNPNNSRLDNDPFANGPHPIEVSEDDLPF